jgi:hypothetical protein
VPNTQPSPPKTAPGDGRSVNYPFIALQSAIAQARKLWDSAGKNLVPLSTAGAAWGYGDKSSGLRSTISALKQYGLLEDIGDGATRQLRLLDRALDILLEAADSPRHRDALAAALSAPKIYREVFDRFPAGLPSHDHAIASFLVRDKAFNRRAVAGFIGTLRANIHFTSLQQPAALYGSTSSTASAEQTPPWVEASSEHPRAPAVSAVSAVNEDVYALGPEGQVVLQWPDRIGQASYDELREWLDLELRKIARINGLKTPQDKPLR